MESTTERRAGRSAALAGGVVVALAILVAFQGLVHPRVTDPDAFYHMGHAAHYAEAGVADVDFPWTAHSVIADEGADLWWGLHVLLVPLAPDTPEELGRSIRAAALVLGAIGVGIVAAVAVAHGWPFAALWPALFLLAVPNALYRYLTVRPEVLSIPLALLLASALSRRRFGWALATAAATTWIHVSMFWLTIGIGVTWVLVEGVSVESADAERPGSPGRARVMATGVVATLLGTALGWLARPEPLATARLAWVQIAQLLAEKADTPLTFATELSPVGVGGLVSMGWPMLLGFAAAIAAGVGLGSKVGGEPRLARERVFLGVLLVLGAGFLVLTLGVARRSIVYMTAFAIPGLGTALALRAATDGDDRLLGVVPRLLLFALVPLFWWSMERNDLNVSVLGLQPDRFAEEAAFLAEAAQPDDIVFNAHWDAFGPLFAHHRGVRYVGGMDPIFQYARSPERYWMFHWLSVGVATAVTCPKADCAPEETVDVWSAIRGEFGARWVLLEPRRDGRLIEHLDGDSRFRRVFSGRDGVVFETAQAVRPTG